MTTTVNDIMQMMERVAPRGLAESWDNVGLQAGSPHWPVKKVWVALEATSEVVEAAIGDGARMLVTHHPFLFKSLKAIDFSTTHGRILLAAAENRFSIFSAHTNLDSVSGGLNDDLAERIGLTRLVPLGEGVSPEKCKVVFYVPLEHKHKVMEALFETEAGVVDNYTCCSFSCSGRATYKPGSDARPYDGVPGEVSNVDEVRVETVVAKKDLDRVISHIRAVHPYEVMAYDVYPLLPEKGCEGIGRVGELVSPLTLREFAVAVREALGLDTVKVAGDAERMVRRVALCTGSGSGMMKHFFKSGADVYISGDLHYHDARDVEAAGRGMIDVGHFGSEIIMVASLTRRLQEEARRLGLDLEVVPCGLEADPFRLV